MHSDAHSWRFSGRKIWRKMDFITWNIFNSDFHFFDSIGDWVRCVQHMCYFFIGLEMTKRFRLGGHIALIILRILMGIGEGTTFPALSVLLAIWVPAKERSKLGSLVLGGGQVSAIFVANLAIFDVVFFSDFNVKNLFICCVFFRLEVLQPTIYLDWF